MMKLGFLASNNGSGLRAIVGAITAGELAAQARLVVSNKRAAPALDFARAHGIPWLFLPTATDAARADSKLAVALEAADVDLVILSGYLRRLGPRVLDRYEGRILNIHPALLPKHGGKGLYGSRVHAAVLAAGDTVSGASVHLVDAEYDHGLVIARVEVPVLAGDTPESLERRVTACEPGLFVETLQKIERGSLNL